MNLRELRRKAGVRQAEAAAVLGVCRGTLSRYEQGKRLPPKRLWEKIAILYGCSVRDVVGAIAANMAE